MIQSHINWPWRAANDIYFIQNIEFNLNLSTIIYATAKTLNFIIFAKHAPSKVLTRFVRSTAEFQYSK